MKGIIFLKDDGWFIEYQDTYLNKVKIYPLHPKNVEKIKEWSLMFDNIEGRIESQPEVEFELVSTIPTDILSVGVKRIPSETIIYAKLNF